MNQLFRIKAFLLFSVGNMTQDVLEAIKKKIYVGF